MSLENLTPKEKLELIGPDSAGVVDTPIGIIQSALLQHFKDDDVQFNALHDLLIDISHKLDPNHEDYINKGIEATLKPISDTYLTVSTMGKWSMAALVSLSMIVGILYTAWQFLSAVKGK